ncbi:MAG: hypothetical protein LLF81_05455 [Porphyromonadaceae bacterium]|nr:hypothetical protein [Porphyromonadaceae bacterium]
MNEFELDELKHLNDHKVYLLNRNDRITIEYNSFDLTKALINLITKAYNTSKEKGRFYKYYLYISGQDFPIKTNSYIHDFLEENYPKPFIDIHPWDLDNWMYHKFKNYYFSLPRTFIRSRLKRNTFNLFGKIVRAPFELPTILFENILTKVIGSPYNKLTAKGYNLYGGSLWWILPDDIISYIVENYRSSYIFKIMKYTKTAEETFFHTFVMNSNLKNRFTVYDSLDANQYSMTYLIFSDKKRPVVTGHPYVFDVTDFDLIISQSHLFARKFDITKDEEILNKIEEYTT